MLSIFVLFLNLFLAWILCPLFNTPLSAALQILLCQMMMGSNPGLLRLWHCLAVRRSAVLSRLHLDKANNPSMSPFQPKKQVKCISNTAEREGGCALASPHLDSCGTVINFQLSLRPGLHSAEHQQGQAMTKSVHVAFLFLVTSLWVQAVKKLPFCAMYRTLWWGYHPQSTVTILRHTVWSRISNHVSYDVTLKRIFCLRLFHQTASCL